MACLARLHEQEPPCNASKGAEGVAPLWWETRASVSMHLRLRRLAPGAFAVGRLMTTATRIADATGGQRGTRTCVACKRGQGPFSLHHWDDGGCKGSFYGATFTLEATENDSLIVRRIEATP